MILRVVASESGKAQTSEHVHWGCRTPSRLHSRSGKVWEGQPKRVIVPYTQDESKQEYPEYHGAR